MWKVFLWHVKLLCSLTVMTSTGNGNNTFCDPDSFMDTLWNSLKVAALHFWHTGIILKWCGRYITHNSTACKTCMSVCRAEWDSLENPTYKPGIK